MADGTKIEWTNATWNAFRGCQRVSPGCQHCYAEAVARRFCGPDQPYEGLVDHRGRWNGEVLFARHKLDEPLRWQRPRHIFVASTSDPFHAGFSFEQVAAAFGVMASATHHTFQLLTKRPGRMLAWFDELECRVQDPTASFTGGPFEDSDPNERRAQILRAAAFSQGVSLKRLQDPPPTAWPLPNVWIGISVEDQQRAAERIPLLLETPARVRWLSCEPLLGGLDLQEWIEALDWIVVGGESGRGARPMRPEWARSLRNQCAVSQTPFFFKQWGAHNELGELVGKKKSGGVLDGQIFHEYPTVQVEQGET